METLYKIQPTEKRTVCIRFEGQTTTIIKRAKGYIDLLILYFAMPSCLFKIKMYDKYLFSRQTKRFGANKN